RPARQANISEAPSRTRLEAGTAKKDAFRRCVTTMGQRHVRGRLLSLSTTNVRRYKWILPRRQNFWGPCGARNTSEAREVASHGRLQARCLSPWSRRARQADRSGERREGQQ